MADLTSIEHVVVLALENQSFDHLLGWVPGAGELSGDECNCLDPERPPDGCSPQDGCIKVSRGADFVPPFDAPHDLRSVSRQIFGTRDPGPGSQSAMTGFVAAALDESHNREASATVMQCYAPEQVPVLARLVEEFCVCRRWHASIPGSTWPNRYFLHAATSHGLVSNLIPLGPGTRTIFDLLDRRGRAWNIYFGLFPQSLALTRLWLHPTHFRPYGHFLADAAAGQLPAYSFIEPRYFDTPFGKANDFHPPHDIRYGEQLIAEVYNALRKSPRWEKTLLLILFDEHGGLYDHMPPPTGVLAPDDRISQEPPFDFRRLGVRVPALLVSPLIKKGTVDDTVYEHCSVAATVRKLFGVTESLNAREAAAATFERNVTLANARSDTPEELQAAPLPGAVAPALAAAATAPAALSDFERDLMRLAHLVDSPRGREARAQARAGNMDALAALAEDPDAALAVGPVGMAAASLSPGEVAGYLQASMARFLAD